MSRAELRCRGLAEALIYVHVGAALGQVHCSIQPHGISIYCLGLDVPGRDLAVPERDLAVPERDGCGTGRVWGAGRVWGTGRVWDGTCAENGTCVGDGTGGVSPSATRATPPFGAHHTPSASKRLNERKETVPCTYDT